MKFFSLVAVALLATTTEASWMKARTARMNAKALAQVGGPAADMKALDKDHDGKLNKAQFMDFFYNQKIANAEAWTDAEVKQVGSEFDKQDHAHEGHAGLVNIEDLLRVVGGDDSV